MIVSVNAQFTQATSNNSDEKSISHLLNAIHANVLTELVQLMQRKYPATLHIEVERTFFPAMMFAIPKGIINAVTFEIIKRHC